MKGERELSKKHLTTNTHFPIPRQLKGFIKKPAEGSVLCSSADLLPAETDNGNPGPEPESTGQRRRHLPVKLGASQQRQPQQQQQQQCDLLEVRRRRGDDEPCFARSQRSLKCVLALTRSVNTKTLWVHGGGEEVTAELLVDSILTHTHTHTHSQTIDLQSSSIVTSHDDDAGRQLDDPRGVSGRRMSSTWKQVTCCHGPWVVLILLCLSSWLHQPCQARTRSVFSPIEGRKDCGNPDHHRCKF